MITCKNEYCMNKDILLHSMRLKSNILFELVKKEVSKDGNLISEFLVL